MHLIEKFTAFELNDWISQPFDMAKASDLRSGLSRSSIDTWKLGIEIKIQISFEIIEFSKVWMKREIDV